MISLPPIAWLLTGSFSWNLAYGAANLMVPLYAYQLGYSGVAIGSLISLPVIMQIVLRFSGGAAADRWGPKSLLIWTFTVMIFAGPAFYFANSFATLLLAQAIVMVSRATYWISAQSAIIRLPGQRNILLGRVTATNNIGQIVGTAVSGILILLVGYRASFLGFSVAGALAVICALMLPPMPGTGGSKDAGAGQRYLALLRMRPLYFAILCSFCGALPLALGQSFLPVLMADVGFSEGPIGFLNALRPVGAVGAGLFLARYITPKRRLLSARLAMAASSLSIIFMPFASHVVLIGLCLITLGMSACLMEVTYQVIASEVGEGIGVTSAMALGGTGWNIAYFSIPILFGSMADTISLSMSFVIGGSIFLLISLGIPYFYRWSQTTPCPKLQPSAEGS